MSDLLLDTHAVLWFFWDDPLLSSAAKQAIESADNRKLVSIASCWEIAIKSGLKKLHLGEPSRSFLMQELSRNNFELLAITFDHATLVEGLASHHRDPFDRLLVAQATAEQLPIVSADPIFEQYGVARVW
jgi:PIN domain nuclease of toxin-antitoxin system